MHKSSRIFHEYYIGIAHVCKMYKYYMYIIEYMYIEYMCTFWIHVLY